MNKEEKKHNERYKHYIKYSIPFTKNELIVCIFCLFAIFVVAMLLLAARYNKI